MCAAVVLGVRRVVGMGLVFARVLLMGTLVMGIFFGPSAATGAAAGAAVSGRSDWASAAAGSPA